MNIENILSKIGLSEKETTVYLTCLQTGTASMSDIARNANYKRSTTYLIVDSLVMKGLISTQKKGAKIYYVPETPKRLLSILRTRERELERALPELEAIYNEPKAKPIIRVYEGIEAVKNIYENMYNFLGGKEEALFFSSVGDLYKYIPSVMEDYIGYIKKLSREKKNYRIRELNSGNREGENYAHNMKKIVGKNHEIRLLYIDKSPFRTDNIIFGNKLIIFSIVKEIFVVVIEDKNISDTYRIMFEAAWKAGKEYKK